MPRNEGDCSREPSARTIDDAVDEILDAPV